MTKYFTAEFKLEAAKNANNRPLIMSKSSDQLFNPKNKTTTRYQVGSVGRNIAHFHGLPLTVSGLGV